MRSQDTYEQIDDHQVLSLGPCSQLDDALGKYECPHLGKNCSPRNSNSEPGGISSVKVLTCIDATDGAGVEEAT